MTENKNSYLYFYACFSFIICGFFINKLKSIFNTTFLQFLENNKEYNQKTAYRTFKDKYDLMTDRLIEKIY